LHDTPVWFRFFLPISILGGLGIGPGWIGTYSLSTVCGGPFLFGSLIARGVVLLLRSRWVDRREILATRVPTSRMVDMPVDAENMGFDPDLH